MSTLGFVRHSAFVFCAAAVSVGTLLPAPVVVKNAVFAAGSAIGAKGPDSIAVSRDSVWVAYSNGADSTGASGSSIVARYDMTGKIVNQYTYPGYVDGLKYDTERDLIWVLQNQDGNSVLNLVDAKGKATTLTYAMQSGSRGYDDVVFINGAIFTSYTNPVGASDPIIQYMTGVNPVTFAPVLTLGATGTNLATQQANQAVTQTDPDSLKATPLGGLMLSSGSDGQLVFVHDLEQSVRSVSFLNILDGTTGKNVSGLDDALFVTTPQGTVYVADTSNNQVLKVDVSGLTPMSVIASVSSLNAVVTVDMKTGTATALIPGLSGPHGLAFGPKFSSLFGAQ